MRVIQSISALILIKKGKKTKNLNEKMQNKSNFQRFLCKTNPIYGINWSLFVVNLKKQSQFIKGQNEHKYLYERML